MSSFSLNGISIDAFYNINNAVSEIVTNRMGKATIAVAINPEKIIMYSKSEEIKNALDLADIRFLDGIGAVIAINKKYNVRVNRIPGCELWLELMKVSAKNNLSVYLLGASEPVNSKAVKALKKQGVSVVGASDGYFDCDVAMINRILKAKPDVLTVALGSPRQEQFMALCKSMGVTSFMMGVGGTLDVYTGSVKRAPKLWCRLNLEWLYRLLSQPKRILRQRNLVVFALRLIAKRL
ncbi:WecB/TagA/CpsF family glycosyltransferase [Vibrio lentus]|uniref:WecB/TagA/CpsF family glycosyltransferase n=1 Tax=Vibrio lentus TaxID=136468 RepID=UPI0024784FB6|nr:WecB/TagA/CpsF family glycosyltransferase [Vibrio lentus]WGS60768.1 WecB/TagA/CpsF family glycosyltransferase [Vibrio lentus]